MKMIFSLYLMLCAVGFIHMVPVSKGSIKPYILNVHSQLMGGEKNLSWNYVLAMSAEELATSCNANEITGEAINYGYDDFTTNLDPRIPVSVIMSTWNKSKKQMAMANANTVGCGTNICPKFRASGKEYENVFYLVCMYEAGPCKDSFDERQCQGWSALGECSRYPQRMLVNCKKSCEVC